MTVGQLIDGLSKMPQNAEVALQIIKVIDKGDVDKIIYVSNMNSFEVSEDNHGVKVVWLSGIIEDSEK